MKRLIICLSTLFLFFQWSLSVEAQEAFVIDDLNIHIRVDEDGTYNIKEEFTLDYRSERHGFYRTIPVKYRMKWTDEESGETTEKRYYFPIDQVSCGNSMCSVDVDGDGAMIKLGDPDKTVIGEQQYTISYRVHTKDLDAQGKQMLYWNLIGNGFDTTVYQMSYTIEMPKAFDATKISTYTGSYGKKKGDLSFQVDGNIIKGELNKPLYNHQSATIRIDLPNDYFEFPKPDDYLFYTTLISAAVTLFAMILFWKFGKDEEVIVSVEFQAPDGLDSAAVGYIADGFADDKDVLSLIIDWANRGFIHIHEEEDHHIKLEKIKDMDSTNAKPYDLSFFNAIFKEKDLVEEADLKQPEVTSAFTKAKKELDRYFHEKSRRIFTPSSMSLQVLMILFTIVPSINCVAAAYMHYGIMNLCIPYMFHAIGPLVLAITFSIVIRKRAILSKKMRIFTDISYMILSAIVFMIGAIIIILWGGEGGWIYALLFMIMEVVLLLVSIFMHKRTPQANRWLGQILGLREFIMTCEKERLEYLVHDQPNMFFHILPYAYVLGVSDVWAKKFESMVITQPQWYHSTYHGTTFSTWLWWSSFHRAFRHTNQAFTYVEPKSSGTGFGGGSFGGGGFSGGGFGGGGGGSW